MDSTTDDEPLEWPESLRRHKPEITRWRVPYPLRAAKISLDISPFGFWLRPQFRHRRDLTEFAREQGETIWWMRWAWFQISYGRWL